MEKRKVDVDIDDDSAGRPWLSYSLFAVAAFVILMFAILSMMYQILSHPIVHDSRPW